MDKIRLAKTLLISSLLTCSVMFFNKPVMADYTGDEFSAPAPAYNLPPQIQNYSSPSPQQNYNFAPQEENEYPSQNDAASEYYKRGVNYYKSNEYSKAISEFEQALKLNPQDPSIRVNLGASYISRGAYLYSISKDKAINDYRKAIYYLKYDDDDTSKISVAQENIASATSNLTKIYKENKISLSPKNRLKMGKVLRGEGNFKEAIVELNEALTDPASKLEACTIIGDIMLVLGNDRAVEYYQKASALDKSNSELHRKIAQSLYNSGDTDGAVKEYNLSLETNPDNAEILDVLENIWVARLKENPQDAIGHMNLGVVLQKKKNLEGAEFEYGEATKLDPNNVTLRLNQGTLFQAKGDYQTAINAYDTILQANPTHPLAHYYRATALKQMGNVKGSVEEYQVILKMVADNVDVPVNIANLTKKEIYETAKLAQTPELVLENLNGIAQTFPNDALAQYNIAFELHSQKRIDEAAAFYKKAISLDPKLIDAYLNLASLYNGNKQSPLAVDTLKNGLVVNLNNKKLKGMLDEIQEDITVAGYEDAVKKYNAGDYDGAIQDYQKLLAENVPNADIYTGLGAAYQAKNKLDEAISSYNKALELEKTNSIAMYSLGVIYYSKKNYDKALYYYQKAQNADPQNNDIKEAIKAVKLTQKEGMLDKGIADYNAKKYLQALNTFNYIIKTDPGNGYAYYYRGLIYDSQKKYLQAIEEYKKAFVKAPELNIALYSLAVDYDILRLKVDAKKAYKKFIDNSKGQNDEYVKYAKQRLQKL